MNPTWLFVGVVYAVAIWMARRAGVDLPKRIALFFYLLVLVFFWQPLTQDFVTMEVDYGKTIPPWAYLERDQRVGNPQMNDVYFQLTPWAHQVRESWRSFDVPLWNGLSGAGYPLLANGQSQALSILRIITLPLSLRSSSRSRSRFSSAGAEATAISRARSEPCHAGSRCTSSCGCISRTRPRRASFLRSSTSSISSRTALHSPASSPRP
jgi:hypothetical protein